MAVFILTLLPEQLVIDIRARDWCRMRYPNHPQGCPNYGRRSSCPPAAPLIADFIDITREMRLAVVDFDLAAHAERMRRGHPAWTERQARCCLYWQNGVRDLLRGAMANFVAMMDPTGLVATDCPEAMGVQVIRTAQKLGVPIHPRPRDIVYKIGLIGCRGGSHKYKKEVCLCGSSG